MEWANYPKIGDTVRCSVLRAMSAQAQLGVFEANGKPTPISYKAVLKGTGMAEEKFLCDMLKDGDLVEGVVVSYGDGVLYISQ